MKTIKGKLLALLLILISVFTLASCKDKTYTLSFVTNREGLTVEPLTVKKEEEINLRDSKYQLTAEGFVFKGWFFDAQLTNMALVFNLEEDTTVYAKWARINTVTFDSNGGTAVQPVKVETGSTLDQPQAPTKEGFKFVGWYKEAELTNKFNFENTEINNDITLYAKWNAIYTVTYHTNGGSEIEPTKVEVGKKFNLPENPTRDGYRFDGWYKDADLSQAFVNTGDITSNLDLYAKWTGNAYTVIFNANGGRGNMAQQSLVYGTESQLSKSIFTRVGYEFKGWALSATGEKELNDEQLVSTLAKTGSVTLYAVWEKVEYTLVFLPNYAEQKNTPETIDDVKIKIDGSVDLTRVLADLDHYTFSKWTLDTTDSTKDYAVGSTFILTEDIISAYANENKQVKLFGLWNPKKYSVEFVGGEGATGSMTAQEFTYGVSTELTHNAFEKEGFFFVGWKDQDNNEYTDGESISASKNLTLTAQWYDAVLTVSFNANGGTGTMAAQNLAVNQATDKAEGKINANVFTKVGYEFAGWALSATGEKAYEDKDDISIETNIELFALWKKANYTLKFNGNGGTAISPMADIVGQIGDSANLPNNTFQKAHFVFKGWALSPNGVKAFDNEALMELNETTIPAFDANKTLTLYAVWEAATYVVTFNPNGATGEATTQTFTYNVAQALTANSFSRDGYKFKGWSLTADGAVLYQNSEEVYIEETTSLYAIWEMVLTRVVVVRTDGYNANTS
ncbi:MAG: InlB B-repeat-containing protein, partial [Gammaproteobacteria bacterium]|nr:InlB B-repeat-containing protein [Gammaproteobacteria bacterium]